MRKRGESRKCLPLRALAVVACVVACAIAFSIASISPAPPLEQVASATSSESASDHAVSRAAEPVEQPGEDLVTIANGEDGIVAEHEAGAVLVQLGEGTTVADLNGALSRLDCVQDIELSESDVSLGSVYVPLAEGVSVPDAMKQLKALPEVQGAQPNFIYHLADGWESAPSADQAASLEAGAIDEGAIGAQSTTINDQYADQQWALKNIEAYDAWDTVKSQGRVTVAVVDTGCNTLHEDLKDNIVQAYDATGYDSITDSDGHGTHVCGIVAAEANNGKGVAGVSYNAQLLPIKVFVGTSASTRALANAYQFIKENASYYNIRVVNLSIGLSVDNREGLTNLDKDGTLYDAVKLLRDEYGILTVCSAGNEADKKHGPYLNFPSDYLDTAMSVVALRQEGSGVSIASYSNYNMPGQKTKDISAPGSSIYSTYTPSANSYGYLQGTSMASPCVAGVAALLFAANPNLTPVQVQDILHNSAVDLGASGWDETYGYGEVNAKNAVSEARLGLFLDGDSSVLVGGSCTLTPSAAGSWTWKSSDAAIARVNASGEVTGVKGGQAVITATRGADGKSVSRTVTVYDISFSGSHQVFVGENTVLKFNENPNTGMWLIGSSDSDIASCNVAGDVTITGVRTGTVTITATLASNKNLKVNWDITVLPARIDFSRARVRMQGWTYDGTAHEPAVTVTLYGSTVPSSNYTVLYSGNVNAGICVATVSPKDTMKYKNVARGTCTVAAVSLSDAEVSLSETSYVYDGPAKTPGVTVKVGQRTLVAGSDYLLSYRDNVRVGTASAVIVGKGNYAGTRTAQFEITSPGPAEWNRLSGDAALDTMRSIVDAGWSDKRNGVVVLTTADGYWDALTAAGVAGMAKAPVLMTDGWSLSAQTEATIRELAPETIVVCGGEAAVSEGVARAAADAAGGANIMRCAGETATGTAVDAFQKADTSGFGAWSSTAFVCTNDGYWDALAAAPVSYAKAMPIFLTEGRSDISNETLSAMKAGGITQVYIVGGEAAIGQEVTAILWLSGISVSDRLWGDTAVETSEAVATFGLSRGMSCVNMGVATTNGYWDALAGAPLCGLKNSVLVLAGDASAHSISGFVTTYKAEIGSCFVFGGEAALDAETYQALQAATS